jgi:hypothetical protein
MVHRPCDPHDRSMGRQRDQKLDVIARSVVGRRASHREVEELGRAGDLIECASGATFHGEHDLERWSYLLLDGDVVLSRDGAPLAVAARGSWFPHQCGPRRAAPMSLTALSDSRLLVFRSFEADAVLDLPTMTFAR